MFFYRFVVFSIITLSFPLLAIGKEKSGIDRYNIAEATEERFNGLQKNLLYYFAYLDSLDGKKLDSKSQENRELLKKNVEEANQLFLDLRSKVRDVFFAEQGNHPNTGLNAALMDSELTTFYVSYLEGILFYQNRQQIIDKEK